MHVIPAIDLLDGNVVRLSKGDYDQAQIYSHDPLTQAHAFEQAGFRYIHIVDLNGARDGRFVNLPYIHQIINGTNLQVQTGGGIRSYEDAARLLESGVRKIISSSMAVRNPEAWKNVLAAFGAERCVFGMDLKGGKIAISGWKEQANQSVAEYLEGMIGAGLREVLCTDISRDGTLAGANVALYERLQKEYPALRFIASGGVSGVEDLERLSAAGVYGVVVGRAYYEGRLTLQEMARHNESGTEG